MSFTPVMISCRQRVEEREDTLAQLAKAGIVPTVIHMACDPPSIEANRYGAFVAAEMAAANGDGLLFLEDDIDIDPKFPEFIQTAINADVVTTFCVMRDRLYPEGYEAGQQSRVKQLGAARAELVELPLHTLQVRRGFHGSQAIYVPPRVVDLILNRDGLDFVDFVQVESMWVGRQKAPGGIDHGFDFWLKEHAHEFGGIYAAYPNPVQHRCRAPSVFGGTGKFVSASFGMPSEGV